MPIRMKNKYRAAGPHGNWGPGVLVPEAYGAELVKLGYAEDDVEQAVAAEPEKAEAEPPDPPEIEDAEEREEWPQHAGGGWYLLPDGRRVRGRDEANEVMEAEFGGD